MSKRTLAALVFVTLSLACIVQALSYYGSLPEKVALHFGLSGQADGWGSRADLLILHLVAVAVTVASFLGLGLALPRLPDWMINLPNKEVWLTPERRPQTIEYLATSLLWLGSLTQLLLLDLFYQTYLVQLGQASRLEHAWLSMAVYLVAITIWITRLMARFKKGESTPA